MLSVVVIGLGRRGREHARLLRDVEGLRIIGLADVCAAARQQSQRELSLPVYASIDETLIAAHPDYVVLATPVRGRAALVERTASFPSVRAILIEKPLALTRAEAERMIAACAERNIQLAVGHHWRFSPDLAAMKAALEAGVIGQVEFFRGVSYGNLLDQGAHLLDAIRWLSGGQHVLWAMSQSCDDAHQLARFEPWQRGYWRDDGHPAPMWMTHHLALSGGARVSLETGLLCPRSEYGHDAWHERRIVAVGTEGVAECRPGHGFRALGKNGAHRHEVSGDTLLEATRRMHEAMRDALLHGRPYPFAMSDALLTLEGLSLCAASAAKGNLAAAPLRADRDYFAAASQRKLEQPLLAPAQVAEKMRFSVLIPLADHRGYAIACVRSWVDNQVYGRDRFEVLVLADGSEPDLEQRVAGLLGPRDRLLRENGANRCRLYDLAANEARGQYLVVTESHCIAEPEFLQELDRYFQATGLDGACCRTIGVCENIFARMDELLHEEGFRQFRQEGDWRKINVHAFALRRSAYLDAGGMNPRYDLFAEMILAAALRDRGCRLGYAAAPAVKHLFRAGLRQVLPDIETYVNGESLYRRDHPGPDTIGHTFLQSAWDSGRQAELVKLWRRTLGQDAWRRLLRGDVTGLKALFSAWRQALQGGRWERITVWCGLQWSMARCQFWRWHPRRLEQAYREVWSAMGRLSRLQFLKGDAADRAAGISSKVLGSLNQLSALPIADVADEDLLGFHVLESWQGKQFRWTGRAALLQLDLARMTQDIRIDTGNLRQEPTPLNLRVYVNNQPIKGVTLEEGVICFRVAADQLHPTDKQILVLTCRPLKPWKRGINDQRELGLPIFGLECIPINGNETSRCDVRRHDCAAA